MPQAQQNRKRRKPHVYLDPSRFTCTACRASFKLAAGLKRHYAQRRDCQPDSDSDTDSSPLEQLEVDPAINLPTSIDQPDAADVPILPFTDPYLDAGNAEMFGYSLDVGGDIGEDAWMGDTEPEPEVSNTLDTEPALRANTTIPSEPSRIEDVFEENYPDVGCVISHSMTPFQHIASIPGYKDAKSSHQVCKACYPFKNPEEVEIIDWLLRNRLSKASINDFVKTKYVSGILMTTPESLIHILQMSA